MNEQYDDLLVAPEKMEDDLRITSPELAPVIPDEPATPLEQDIRDDIVSEFVSYIYDQEQRDEVVTALAAAPEMYIGVSSLAFNLLEQMVNEKRISGEEVPASVVFGAGGLIHAGVDELFSLAQAAGVPGATDPDQYQASIFDMYRRVGELIEQSGDDDAVREAQELMMDIEEAGNGGELPDAGEPDEEELVALDNARANTREASLANEQEEMEDESALAELDEDEAVEDMLMQEAGAEEQAGGAGLLNSQVGLQLPDLPPVRGGLLSGQR